MLEQGVMAGVDFVYIVMMAERISCKHILYIFTNTLNSFENSLRLLNNIMFNRKFDHFLCRINRKTYLLRHILVRNAVVNKISAVVQTIASFDRFLVFLFRGWIERFLNCLFGVIFVLLNFHKQHRSKGFLDAFYVLSFFIFLFCCIR